MSLKLEKRPIFGPARLVSRLAFACIFVAAAMSAAFSAPVGRSVFVKQAEAAFAKAWATYQADTNSIPAARDVGQTSSELAGLATNDTQRADVARRGIAVCRAWLEKETNSAFAHYYLGINLGQLAKAEAPSLAAYRLVHEVEREFKQAAELDATVDHAGPARTLGLLYFQAPGWPLSVGSKTRAREWLMRAVELAPDYPGNQLNLAEAQLKWREPENLAKTIKKMDTIWPVARTNFVGEAWQENWQDWDARRTALKIDYQRLYGEKE